jgi:hypothetical protein
MELVWPSDPPEKICRRDFGQWQRRGFRYDALLYTYRGADKSLARPGRKQATATEDFDVHVSYL